MSNPPDERDPLLERLRESATGDAALRQLRRRYDILRQDYEQLIDRLGELEERLAQQQEMADAAEAEPRRPVAAFEPQTVAESLASPLLRMRDEYLAAADSIQAIVLGLEELAANSFGGRMAPQRSARMAATPADEPAAPLAPASNEPVRVQIEAHGQGFGELLDFQERLAQLTGVARVSINAIDNETSSLVVELEPPQ